MIRVTGPFIERIYTGVALALFPSDGRYNYEIQRAPDVAGAPGAYATIASDVPPDTEVYVDRIGADGAARWYRVRNVGFGDTPGAWVGPISAVPGLLPASSSRPDAVLPSFVEDKGVAGNTVTLTVAVTDPQFRLTLMEFGKETSAGTTAYFTVAGPSPYGTNMSTSPGTNAVIRYRATGYGADGVLRVLKASVIPVGMDADAAGPMHLAIDASGSVLVYLNGSDKTLSWTYAYSTTSMPSDAAAIAGTLVNGRAVAVLIAAAIILGGTVYVKAVSWSGASGTGVQGQVVSATQTRQNKTGTKTLRIPHSAFSLGGGAATFDTAKVSTSSAAATHLYAGVVLPPNCILKSCAANIYTTPAAADVAWVTLDRVDASDSSTQIGSSMLGSQVGWETPFTSFTESMGSAPYSLHLFMQAIATGAGGCALAYVELTYDSPDLFHTV